MDEQLLTILKLCLLALLYLFFFRVLRAVWAEVRGPQLAAVAAPRQAARQAGREAKRVQRSAPPVQLAVVEPAAQKGRAYPLTEELTVGRAAGCGVAFVVISCSATSGTIALGWGCVCRAARWPPPPTRW